MKKESKIIALLLLLCIPLASCGLTSQTSESSKHEVVEGKNEFLQTDKNGVTPHIGENGNWFIGDSDTGVCANGVTPHIGENGNWFIADTDTGVSATGLTPHIGENGNWFIGDSDTGVSATGLKDFKNANISIGFGEPTSDCDSEFYFDIETNSMYEKKDSGYVQVSTLNPAINQYESTNYLLYSQQQKIANGVQIDFDSTTNGYIVDGLAEHTFTYNVYSQMNTFPTGFTSGSNYYFSVEKSVPGLSYNILYYCNGAFVYAYDAYGSGVFSIPEDATGLCVRMVFTQGYSYDNVLTHFGIYNEFSFKRLMDFLTVTPPRPMLSIIDDDGNKKFHQYLLPLCQEKEIPISSAVITNWVGKGNTMSWEQISDCFVNGVEILSHSHSHHTVTELDSMSLNQIQYDYQKSKNILASHGYVGDTLVFPYGSAVNEKCIKAAKNVFSYGFRAGTNKTNKCGKIDNYGFDRYNISDVATTSYMTGLIDQLVSDNTGYMVWMLHTSSNGFSSHNVSRLSAAIDYCLSQGVDIVTTSTGIKAYTNPTGF